MKQASSSTQHLLPRRPFGRLGTLFGLAVCLLLIACGNAGPDGTLETAATPFALPTPPSIPPTFTPAPIAPRPSQTPDTRQPTLSPIPSTPIPFDDTVIAFRLRIPAIDLDRRLQGNVSSEIIVVDETAKRGQQRRNQAFILLELQQVLESIELEPVPDGCDRCVELTVEFPLEERTVSGWLQDPVLLASIENFMVVTLGPHFPPDTVVGLHRTASPYAPAQTAVLRQDGSLWVWQANLGEVPEPQTAESGLADQLAALQETDFRDQYDAPCPGVPVETLQLGMGETAQTIIIACPQFSLPTALLPVYLPLNDVLAERITDTLPAPDSAFPLTGLLDYRREDARLMVFADGTAVVSPASGLPITTTLALSDVISITDTLIENDTVLRGFSTFAAAEEPAVLLLLRGPRGVYDAGFASSDQTALAPLNILLDGLLPLDEPTPTPLPETTPLPSPTP